MGILVSNDTIGRLYSRLSIEDATDIQAVGIDDVAIRKGQTYATAIYDLADHHMIALLEGRESEALKEWLKDHPLCHFSQLELTHFQKILQNHRLVEFWFVLKYQ